MNSRIPCVMKLTISGALLGSVLLACESLQSRAPTVPGPLTNTAPRGTTTASLALNHHYVMSELVGDQLGPTGGALIGAAPEKFDQHKTQEAIAAAQKAERSPATVAQARDATTADINGDGFVTLDEIVALKWSGLSDAEIVERLRNTDQVFSLTPEQQRYLTDRRVGRDVVNAIRALAQNPGADAQVAGANANAGLSTTQPSGR